MEPDNKSVVSSYECLSYELLVGFTYHRKREWFYGLLDKLSAAIAVIGTSSVLANISKADGAIQISIQLFIVVFSTLGLVFGWSNKSRQHSELAARYAELERRLQSHDSNEIDAKSLREISCVRLEIEALEPPTSVGLVQLVQDEIDASRGIIVSPERFYFRRRLLAHFGFGVMQIPDTNQTE